MSEDERVCDTCGATTDINECWTDCGMYWCSDECVPKWKWVQMFGEEMNDICVWDIQFCKKDEDGNELLNDDGSVKLFQLKREHDVSFIAEGTDNEDLEEVNDNE